MSDKGLLKGSFEEILREIQGLLAISYVFLIIIGMLYDVIYYALFGINIYEYAEILDFLVGPFKRPTSIFFFLTTVILSYVAYLLDLWMARVVPRIHNVLHMGLAKKKWYQNYRIVIFIITFLLLSVIYASLASNIEKKKVFKDDNYKVRVILDSEKKLEITGRKIGANSGYLFLLDADNKVQIFSFEGSVERVILNEKIELKEK